VEHNDVIDAVKNISLL